MGVSSVPVAPFIGPRRKPKAWGRIGSTAVMGGGCGVRLPSYPGEPPPAPIGRLIASSHGPQSGRLAMLQRIATHRAAESSGVLAVGVEFSQTAQGVTHYIEIMGAPDRGRQPYRWRSDRGHWFEVTGEPHRLREWWNDRDAHTPRQGAPDASQ